MRGSRGLDGLPAWIPLDPHESVWIQAKALRQKVRASISPKKWIFVDPVVDLQGSM
jgi:hypothetical protein